MRTIPIPLKKHLQLQLSQQSQQQLLHLQLRLQQSIRMSQHLLKVVHSVLQRSQHPQHDLHFFYDIAAITGNVRENEWEYWDDATSQMKWK